MNENKKENIMEEPFLKNNVIQLENTYVSLPEAFYTKQYPSKVPSPKLMIWNEALAKQLGLPVAFFQSDEGVEALAGNKVLEGTTPIAQAYAGHQFGHFTMLGDGRAILLGEYVTKEDERVDIQLKGSGITPYSRRGDGKAALGPMLREYIISEGMKGLGIPTTRSLAVLTTGEIIMREGYLPGAILVRIAKSHIRVGTFQYASHFQSKEELKALADYTLERHFKESIAKESPYIDLLQQVVRRQAELIAKWQLVGFIHGVMNTDNMAISGETIDYGPCAFMDRYHPDTVFSSIDTNGRYAYKNQPQMAAWNLARFAEALLPLLHDNQEEAVKLAEKEVNQFFTLYHSFWYEGMRRKLGLFDENEMDYHLIEALLGLMQKYNADYTNTFRQLTLNQLTPSNLTASEEFKAWFDLWQQRLEAQKESLEAARSLMEKNNPTIIPRNHRVEEALEQAVIHEDYSVLEALVRALQNPYDYQNLNDDDTVVPEAFTCGYKTYCGT